MNRHRTIALASAVVAAIFIAVGTTGTAAAATDLVLRFDAPVRTVIDNGPSGTSVGDLTITSGDVRKSESTGRIGYYATNQVTVRADSAAGREIRKVDLSISLPGGMLFATSLIHAQTGVPPTKPMTFAITGGTGRYAAASGTLVHEGVAGKPGFAVHAHLN